MASASVTVVVPSRDRRPLLERKLRALEGERAPFEVVVVADACGDDTEGFLAAYRPPYPLRWARGPGVHAAAARNLGAGLAAGEVLLFSDDDVIPRPGWVAAHARLHRRPGMAGLSTLVRPPHLERGVAATGRAGWWHCSGAGLSLERSVFAAVGGYATDYGPYGGEDSDLGWRLRRAGVRFRRLPDAVAEHWDEGFERDADAKAEALGRAQVAVVRRARALAIAWPLGVHPVLLAAKSFGLRWLPAGWLRWERAFTRGARRAWREVGGRGDAGADVVHGAHHGPR